MRRNSARSMLRGCSEKTRNSKEMWGGLKIIKVKQSIR